MRVSAGIGLGAITSRNGEGGAYRVWTLARWLDRDGSGWIREAELTETLDKWDVHPVNYTRWIEKAVSMGVFGSCSKGRYWYKKREKAAVLFKAPGSFNEVKLPDPARLFGPGWRPLIWAAFLESLGRKDPISRETLERMTGVSERQQRRWENGNKHVKKRIVLVDRGEAKEGFTKFEDSRYRKKDGRIIEQLPNFYFTDLNRCRKGSTRKTRQALRECSLLSSAANTQKLVRRYYAKRSSAERASSRSGTDKFYRKKVKKAGPIFYGVAEGLYL